MKKITKGNDFTMRIPVCKMEGGEQVPYPLPACTDIVVNLVNAFRRRPLTFSIDVAHDNIILAKVEENLPCATYALEVKGKCLGNDWRSNEYEQIQIVDNNASADYNFSELQEGENSVDMDTAIIILAPSVELESLLTDTKEALKKVDEAATKSEEATRLANIALEEMDEKMSACATVTIAAVNAAKSATDASTSANSAADRANSASERIEPLILETQKALKQLTTTTATANELVVKLDQNEQLRVVAEQKRVNSETTRKTDEQARIDAENARITAETRREQSAKDNKTATEKAVKDCQQAVKDAQVAVDYDPDTYSLIITTGTEE